MGNSCGCGCRWVAILVVASIAVTAGHRGPAAEPARGIVSHVVGRMPDGRTVEEYTLTNSHGLEVRVLNYGATLTAVKTADRHGHVDNITLFLDTFDDYLRGHPLFGSTVGRFANRIADAAFTLDGTHYRLTANAAPHHIHGGPQGFYARLWEARAVLDPGAAAVILSLVSKDGEEGYPGTLAVDATYKLTENNELVMDYTARTDKPTHVNLTNHAYWNLAGAGSGDVLGHTLMINANMYLLTDDKKIPTGEFARVSGTPLDFTEPRAVGSRIEQVPGGYDHCYVLNKKPGEALSLAARVADPMTGRVMEVYTTQPGLQLYTANGLSNQLQGAGRPYGAHHALCLEAQHFPDSPNKPGFPSTVLRPGESYHQTTVYRFSVD